MPFPVEEKFIQSAEQKLGVTFPTAYRAKMATENGGSISVAEDDWELYPFLDNSDRKRLARTCNDIVKETNNARTQAGFPANAIAIGNNGEGDLLILMPKSEPPGELAPSVHWWNHETREVTKLAADFSELP